MGDDIFSRIVAQARESSLADQVETEANLAAERIRARAERLERYRETLPDDDYRRALRGELDSEAWRIVSRFLAGRLRFLWLCGGPGTGKTVAFASVLAERGGLLVLGADLVRAFRSVDRDSADLRHRAKHAGLLVLDDLGTSDPNTEATALFEIVNARQGGNCLTLITGNQSKSEVEALDPRIVSRVKKQGVIVEIAGADMRRGQR